MFEIGLNNQTFSKYLTNYYSIRKYNDDYYKLTYHKMPLKAPGFDSKSFCERSRDVNKDKLSNNLIRAKNKIFELSMCNDFEYFVTLTLDPKKYDRYDLSNYIKDLGQFIRDYRKKYDVDIQYLLIPEQHSDGAWHMHGLVRGIPKEHLSNNLNGFKSWNAYTDKFGFMSIDDIRSKEAVSKYITKYITKSIGGVFEKNKKSYYATRGLNESVKIKEGTFSSSELERIPFNYENDFIKIVDLNFSQFNELVNQISD